MPIDFVGSETAPFYTDETSEKPAAELLWGDRVDTRLDSGGSRIQVRARGRTGWVDKTDLGGSALLEVYIIDVGQGDGVLIRTPDGKHVLIDGGYKRSMQPTGKNAADFVDWKFARDYGSDAIELDAMIASHNDADHYGGLWDLVNPNETEELDLATVRVGAFYHAGVGWWQKNGTRSLGVKQDGFLKTLVGDRDSAVTAMSGVPSGHKLQGDWRSFISHLLAANPAIPFKRLSRKPGQPAEYIPQFGPGECPATLKVLGPIEQSHAGAPAYRSFGSDSQNTNGHSVLLRLDYGRARILLTGDLNAKAQRALLDAYSGERLEFACDVAKGCHHGSDDVSFEFLETMGAAATVISSGDVEGHSHPRPSIVAASALTGHKRIENDEIITPLVYSTEIARSVRLGKPVRLRVPEGAGTVEKELGADYNPDVLYVEKAAGDFTVRNGERKLAGTYVVSGIVYGLVNVRTDGDRILCATMNEKANTWDVRTFTSRF
jgi:beta-lactamase superfamily II metal-dependent hydrolase